MGVYAANHATPVTVETKIQRIFNIAVCGQGNCISVLLLICEEVDQFDRLYEEPTLTNINALGTTSKRMLHSLFSPNRNIVPPAAGECTHVNCLRNKSLNGNCTELVSGKFVKYSQNTSM